jgi:hypothetical protein
MRVALKQFTKCLLLLRVKDRVVKLGIEEPDRTAKRYRDALICLFHHH